ncbi:MAG: Caldesmon [Planctomycetota bacterium]|nr:MAG: Caldesmon [Planctomycetota bacterium]
MRPDKSKISCPECGEEIDVNNILYHQLDEQLKKQYKVDLAKEKGKFDVESSKLLDDRKKLDAEKVQNAEQIEKQVKDGIKKKEVDLKKKIKAEAAEEQAEAMTSLKEELDEKSKKLKKLNKTSAELEKVKREKDELSASIKAEAEKELSKKLIEEKAKIQKEESDKNEFKFKELKKQLEDQKKLTEEMKRKQDQGSMQTQGEVQELAIEEWLSEKFPLDVIQEIKKGERGADCLQIIHSRSHQNCGTIYYESKRTKAFQNSWIEKFKSDIRDKNANIGVLVTDVMPSDMERFGLKDGIWICTFEEFKGLCNVLRESIIQMSTAIITQENKGDKMGMLYDFLTSNEFKLQIESIVEGFTQMKTDLESEQRSMRSIWKKREKQIEKVLLSTTDMYGSIKGIAGNALQTISLLELPSGQEINSDE